MVSIMSNTRKLPSKAELTLRAADSALREMVAEGARISQHAVEMRAGLSNGALNYNHPNYVAMKERIAAAKAISTSTGDARADEKRELLRQKRLKEKYRAERDQYKRELAKALGEKLELTYQLFHAQDSLAQLDEKIVIDENTVREARLGKKSHNAK